MRHYAFAFGPVFVAGVFTFACLMRDGNFEKTILDVVAFFVIGEAWALWHVLGPLRIDSFDGPIFAIKLYLVVGAGAMVFVVGAAAAQQLAMYVFRKW